MQDGFRVLNFDVSCFYATAIDQRIIDKRLKQCSIFMNSQNDKFVQCLSPSNILSSELDMTPRPNELIGIFSY